MRTRLVVSILLLLHAAASCSGEFSGPGSDGSAVGDPSGAGDVRGVGDSASPGDTPSGDATAGGDPATGGDSASGGDPGTFGDDGGPAGMAVLNVQSAASAINGDALTISAYSVPADGILVVRGGAAGPAVQNVTFGGVALTRLASRSEPDYWFAISADVYWMPVSAGQSGDIEWLYQSGAWTTRRRGVIAATVTGVTQIEGFEVASEGEGTNQNRTGPSLAELSITTPRSAVILSAFTSNGPGPSDLTGAGHTLDAFPTVPIQDFHSTRVYGGHALVGPGTVTLGYQNNETNGWFDYILFLIALTDGG